MVVQMGEDFWGVGIEHIGGRNEWLYMDNFQVRSLPVSSVSTLLTSFDQCMSLIQFQTSLMIQRTPRGI